MLAAFPRVLAGRHVAQIWAYKYDSASAAGIAPHADPAGVNVNVWLTPDDANLDPSAGGLIVYHDDEASVERARALNEYTDDEKEAIRARVAAGARTRIAYRRNRVVMFNSRLFHESDRFSFKSGYKNRRINLTLLFA